MYKSRKIMRRFMYICRKCRSLLCFIALGALLACGKQKVEVNDSKHVVEHKASGTIRVVLDVGALRNVYSAECKLAVEGQEFPTVDECEASKIAEFIKLIEAGYTAPQ